MWLSTHAWSQIDSGNAARAYFQQESLSFLQCTGRSVQGAVCGLLQYYTYFCFAEPMNSTAISDQIDRILRSQSFASKAQLRRLLELLSNYIDSQSALSPELVIKEL
jgi:hypothetical protein